MKKKIWLSVALVVGISALFVLKWADDNLTVRTPEYPPIGKVSWLPQNWTAEQRQWFYHADQGTQTFGIPYEWFIALEQPPHSFTASGLLSDPIYLDRFGFIPSSAVDQGQPDLPVGFAHSDKALDDLGAPFLNPQKNAQMTSLGFTCAACHTGRFTYQETTVLVDGGAALTSVQNFQKAVGLSIIYTHWFPWRFARFEERVLGPAATDDAKAKLRQQFNRVYAQVIRVVKLENAVKRHTVDEGYTRLDALSRIGNTVFAVDLGHDEDFVAYSAPVHFPHIWNASWFEWVQYNGSIQNPMTRNAGEALGVHATVSFADSKDPLPASSVKVDTIFQIEELLAGEKPPTAGNRFTGLNSPKWRDTNLPSIKTDLAKTGAALYKKHCEKCHLPATNNPATNDPDMNNPDMNDPAFWTVPQWSPANAAGERYLDLHMINISFVGTDPSQAEDMKNRAVAVPANVAITNESGHVVTSIDFGSALKQLVDKVVNRWYDAHSTLPAVRDKMNGFRSHDIRALLQYKARPLNGIWAAPPYLHNGSVPNLYALLSPVAERPKCFYLGNREYDPTNVGYHTEKLPGGFKFDASIRGNSNAGHEFNDGSGKGIIGPLLKPDERLALIEYLKTL